MDAVIKTAVAESPENAARIQGWVAHWRHSSLAALAPLAEAMLGEVDGPAALASVDADFGARLTRLGLAA